MSNKGWTESLALKCARHPRITVGVWIVALFLAVFSLVNLLGDSLVTEQKTTNNPESEQAKTLMNERLGIEESKDLDEMIIVRSKTLTVDDPAYQAQVMGIFGELTALGPDAFLGGVTYYIALDPSLSMDANTLVSADRHTTYIPFKMPPNGDEKINMVYAIGDKYANDTFEIYHTGSAAFMADSIKLGEDTARQGEIIGILAALVVLVIVFGAVVAALLPIALGIVAIIIALGLTGLVGQITDLTFMITNMITMMGLAVGIDYSLFILTRFREERANGRSKIEAIGAASNTAGRAIFFSGVTVMLALTGLIIFPLSIFISLGIGAILVVFAAIIASMTLLPAMLSLFGDKVNALRIPFIKSPVARGAKNTNQGFWAKMSKFVTNNAVASLIITVAILGAAVIPFFDKNTGMSGLSGLPDYLRSKQGYMVLQQEFHTALEDPVLIVIDGDISSPATQSGIVSLQKSLANDAAFSGSMVVPYVEKNMAIVYARLGKDSMELSSVEAAGRVRKEYIPQAFKDTSVTVLVGGSSAFMFDFNETTADYTPLIFGMVLVLSFVVLILAFRSIVIPIKAIAMNLLSVGAAYGLIVLVFQKGVGNIFGFIQVESIETWLPLFLFAVLFGLSMDYHIFLLSRVREHYILTGDNSESVAFGLQSTGRLITGAALIMVVVFAGFALGDMTMMQQMGFGLAVAVFLDATLVRCILVPAAMKLLGNYNWYLPKWLKWLPNISLGE